jgi:CheY-like chemotaxis protein
MSARGITAVADGAKILVVDDDPDMVESIKLILESETYGVVTAGSAEEGFAQLEAEKPDLILLDVMMPEGTEGFQFVWKLRNQYGEDLSGTPVVIVTAIHDHTRLRLYPEQQDGTYEAGEYLPVQGFIDKPVTPAQLLDTVRKVLSK